MLDNATCPPQKNSNLKNNFSPLLKEVLSLSREEAIRLHNKVISTGHVLVAILRQGQGATVQGHSGTAILLKQAAISLPDLQREIETGLGRENMVVDASAGRAMIYKKRFWGKSSPQPTGVRLSREVEKAIRVSLVVAAHLKSPLVQPEHLLLSILKDKGNWVAGILSRYGLTYEVGEERLRNS